MEQMGVGWGNGGGGGGGGLRLETAEGPGFPEDLQAIQ